PSARYSAALPPHMSASLPDQATIAWERPAMGAGAMGRQPCGIAAHALHADQLHVVMEQVRVICSPAGQEPVDTSPSPAQHVPCPLHVAGAAHWHWLVQVCSPVPHMPQDPDRVEPGTHTPVSFSHCPCGTHCP